MRSVKARGKVGVAMRSWVERLIPYKWWAIVGLTLGMLTIAANLGLTSTAAYLIAKAAQHPSTILLLWVPIVGVRAFGTARGVLRYGDRYFSHDVTFRLLKDLRVRLYQALEPLPPDIFRRYPSGDLLARFGADIETLQNAYLGLLSPLLIAIGGIALASGMGWMLSSAIGGVLLVSLSAAGLWLPWHMARVTQGAGRQLVIGRAQLTARWVDWIYGLADILTLDQDASAVRWHEAFQAHWRTLSRRINRLKGWIAACNEGLQHGIAWLVLWVAVRLATSHHLPGLDVVVAVFLALASFEAIRPLAGAFSMRAEIAEATARVEHLVQSTVLDEPAAIWRPDPRPPRIEVAQLWFRYTSQEPWVFQGANLTLLPGEPTVLLGESGSGKSSLIALLVRFYRPQSGQLLYDGHPWPHIADFDLLRNVGVVNQHPHLFATTLRQNLLLARPGASEEDLWSALDGVQLADGVHKLPQGLDTVIGDHGSTLSGGQQKRLALARVWLKDAPVWLLDEPTEGLDIPLARVVMAAVLRHAAGKTLLWVSHDHSYRGLVDRVMELADGCFVDPHHQGTGG